jgi:8-oxo-dGTP pyrophosphatase MutT (NUDIX family)
MAAGALFFDASGKFLILRTSYKDTWEIPGGAVEDDESPREAAEREIKEEIGLSKHMTKLICLDYQDAEGIRTESLMFIFDGGTLSDEDMNSIKVDAKEILEFRFVTSDEALPLCGPRLGRRIQNIIAAKETDTFLYLENRELPL